LTFEDVKELIAKLKYLDASDSQDVAVEDSGDEVHLGLSQSVRVSDVGAGDVDGHVADELGHGTVPEGPSAVWNLNDYRINTSSKTVYEDEECSPAK